MTRGLDLFEEREPPPMSAEMFTTLVVARLRAVGKQVEGQGRLELAMRSGEGLRIANLGDYYRRYREAPSYLSPLIRELTESVVRGAGWQAAPNSYERVASHLMPLLVTAREWQQKKQAGVRLVVRSLLPGLGVALVVEGKEASTFVDLEMFESWTVDIGSAYETALVNLGNRTQGIAFSQTGDGAHRILVDRTADGYAATRALIKSRLEDWASRVPGELVLGIPSRGFLIGFSSDNPNLGALAAQIEDDATPDEHGLCKGLLVYRDHKLQVFSLPDKEPIGA